MIAWCNSANCSTVYFTFIFLKVFKQFTEKVLNIITLTLFVKLKINNKIN